MSRAAALQALSPLQIRIACISCSRCDSVTVPLLFPVALVLNGDAVSEPGSPKAAGA